MPDACARPLVRDDSSQLDRPIVVAHRSAHEAAARPTRPVTHSYAALAFFTAGRSRMEQNGQWDVAAGDVVLVPAGQAHRTLQRARVEYWGLAFCAACVAASGAASLLAPFERVRDGGSAVVSIPEARRAFLASLFGELTAESAPAVEQSLLTLILSEVERASALLAPPAPGAGGVVAQSLRFIERNCLKPRVSRTWPPPWAAVRRT